jgi:DNA-directed RNA polymerase specialized sigma24 family protein
MFHYAIRPDGSIRKVSQRQTPVNAPDVHVTSPTHYAPGQYRYNFETEGFGEIDPQEIADFRGQRASAAAQAAVVAQQRRTSIRSKINALPSETREVFDLLLEELGIDL